MKIYALVIGTAEGSVWEFLCATKKRAQQAHEDFVKEECEGDASLMLAEPLEDDVAVREWNGPESDEDDGVTYAWTIIETEVLE